MTRTPDTPITRGPLTLIRGNAPRFTRTDWRRHVVQPAPSFPALPDVNRAAHPLAPGFYLDRLNAGAGTVAVVAVDRHGRRVFEASIDGRLCYALEAAGIFAAAADVLHDLPADVARIARDALALDPGPARDHPRSGARG